MLSEVAFRPPVIQTERLLLRPWDPNDADAVYAYASDPEVARYMFWHRHESVADAHFFLNEIVAEGYDKGWFSYALCSLELPELAIGGVSLEWKPEEHQVMELGYVLARDHWGKGYVPEAARTLLGHAFSTTPVERVFAPIFSENVKSRRAAEKIGLTLEGVLRSSLSLRGRRWDQSIYSLLRSDSAAPREARA
jgi:ribosomal-protein-alanine N-acetyltransferase